MQLVYIGIFSFVYSLQKIRFALVFYVKLLVCISQLQDSDDDDWFPEDIFEAFKELRKRKIFDVEDMYTIADAWGWTWEKDIKNKPPRRWNQEWEVELAVQIMTKVCTRAISVYQVSLIF